MRTIVVSVPSGIWVHDGVPCCPLYHGGYDWWYRSLYASLLPITMIKRSLLLEGLGIELPLTKATAIHVEKQMIHIDQLADGTWRIIYNASLIPDITKLEAIKIIRDDTESV